MLDDGLSLIVKSAEIIIEEVGIEFHDDEEALQICRDVGADVQGQLVKFPRGISAGTRIMHCRYR
ncbi:trimethylamine methyltransferase family protein [Amphritea sp.]|uniref:trimethylamine methyltransferase family protein n=1 Tax=Amphritea sp. TaxID=1872502 RepID=UPI0025C16513|nr:trimethylamine methyltransferase family protein [Amphritea sp.]